MGDQAQLVEKRMPIFKEKQTRIPLVSKVFAYENVSSLPPGAGRKIPKMMDYRLFSAILGSDPKKEPPETVVLF
jgi:hypothetical protein